MADFEWVDKKNGENGDFILAEDINSIAKEVTRLGKISSTEAAINYKGETDSLPKTAEVGDVYKLKGTQICFRWNGEAWETLSPDKISYLENDAGFLAYESTETAADANEYWDFKIVKTADTTENLPGDVPSDKRWGLIFTLLENAELKTGVQYFFDSIYKLYTRNCYSGYWDTWHIAIDPRDDVNTLKTYLLRSNGYSVDDADGSGTYSVDFAAKTSLYDLKDVFLFLPTSSNEYGVNYINLGVAGSYPICCRENIGGSYTTLLPAGFFQAWRAVMLVYSGGYFEVLNYWG